MNPVLKKNFAIFPVLDWIATLTTHIPNKGEQLIRYYGYYSNVSRGKRKKKKPEEETEISEIDAPPLSKELKKRWSYFIRKVYETDPLTCPKCQGDLSAVAQAGMRIICASTQTGRNPGADVQPRSQIQAKLT